MKAEVPSLITIDAIYQKANGLIAEKYPLLGKDYIKHDQIIYVVKAIILLDKETK